MRTLPQWLDWQQRQHPQSIALGLDRVREIYARLQLPSPRRCVTIAGTNGKGTVAHALDALATARSWRTGRYTSPHLYRYNERVCLGGTPVDDATLCDAFEAIESVRGQIPLTFFEYGTLAALWVFARADVDLTILEVGLGGRLDATNIVDADHAVLCSLSLDHQDWLGSDLQGIAREKAGICRPGRPAWIASVEAEPLYRAVLGPEVGPVYVLGRDFPSWSEAQPFGLPPESLAVAKAVDGALAEEAEQSSADMVLRTLQIPGRCERRLEGDLEYLLDVAHNPAAAERLAQTIRSLPPLPTALVVGMQADKDMGAVCRQLQEQADAVFCCSLPPPRGAQAEALSAFFKGLPCQAHPNPASAVQAARQWLANEGGAGRIIICGSFVTLGESGLG